MGLPTFDFFLKKETPCELLARGDGHGSFILVAYGQAQPPRDRVRLHNQAVADIHYVVSISEIVPGFEELPLPLPNTEVGLHSVTDALGSYVLWPRALVRLSDEVSGKADRKGKKACSPQEGRRDEVEKENVFMAKCPLITEIEVVQGLSSLCFWLHECASDVDDEAIIEIQLSHHQFHYFEDTSTFISKVDIKEFLCGEELNVSMIQTFMRLLYKSLIASSEPMFGWLCPSIVRDDSCLRNKREVKEYLNASLKACSRLGYKIILLPYIEMYAS
ncbi:uncharacterized protein LOC130591875 [Beta vulgaris subsp. vulgaris]|uniref:uncharacterized protein LOC130591875 n=1 Tax=Beta vulgaris subsp. vulgaris TaxID=3555 RepID=UPI002548F14F|nr:uncharacterized protein LOC130591875 [Beta vulgaris subsp. vulgaris]